MTFMPFRAVAIVALGGVLIFAGAPAAQAGVVGMSAASAAPVGAVAAAPDLSVASSLVGLVRTSAVSVSSGGAVSFLWKVRDVGATSVVVAVRDVLGADHQVRWDGPAGFSGVASATVDSSSWPAGAYTVSSISVSAANGFVTYQPGRNPSPNPTGLKVVPPTNLKFPALGFTVG